MSTSELVIVNRLLAIYSTLSRLSPHLNHVDEGSHEPHSNPRFSATWKQPVFHLYFPRAANAPRSKADCRKECCESASLVDCSQGSAMPGLSTGHAKDDIIQPRGSGVVHISLPLTSEASICPRV
jgi:hypothetical protein